MENINDIINRAIDAYKQESENKDENFKKLVCKAWMDLSKEIPIVRFGDFNGSPKFYIGKKQVYIRPCKDGASYIDVFISCRTEGGFKFERRLKIKTLADLGKEIDRWPQLKSEILGEETASDGLLKKDLVKKACDKMIESSIYIARETNKSLANMIELANNKEIRYNLLTKPILKDFIQDCEEQAILKQNEKNSEIFNKLIEEFPILERKRNEGISLDRYYIGNAEVELKRFPNYKIIIKGGYHSGISFKTKDELGKLIITYPGLREHIGV